MEKTKVKLDDIIEALEFSDALHSYLNRATGKVLSFTEETLSAADHEEKPLLEHPEWMQEPILEARRMRESNDWIAIPGKFDLDEYRIMQNFCYSVEDEEIARELIYAIDGSGAFRRFKNAIHRYGIADQWYQFRQRAFERFATDWLEAEGFEWE